MKSSEYLPIQFKIGIAGIIASLIWIGVKFGIFHLSILEWISLSGAILSLACFYHFAGTDSNSSLFYSILLFFVSISVLIYFHQNESFNNRINFDFSILIYGVGFSFGTFFLTRSFYSRDRLKLFFVALIFFLGTLGFMFLRNSILSFVQTQPYFNSLKNFSNISITLVLILILFYPVRNIFQLLFRKAGNDQ